MSLMEKELLRIIMYQQSQLWNAVLCGHLTPSQKELYDRMSNPMPGDLVMEMTTRGRLPEEQRTDALGWLLLIRRESPKRIVGEWIRDGYEIGEKIPSEEVYYIETFQGLLLRWHNANFTTVPLERSWKLFDLMSTLRRYNLDPPEGMVIASEERIA